RRGPAQRDLRRTGELDAPSDPRPSRDRCSHGERAGRAVRDDASLYLEAHQGAGTSRVGRAGSASPIPTVRHRRSTTHGGLQLGRAIPARLGGPLRPHGRLPQATPITTKDVTMTGESTSPDAV